MRRLSRQLGVTLIELLVTLTVIGVLATQGLPAYSSYVQNAKLREGATIVSTTLVGARDDAKTRGITTTVVSTGAALAVTQMDSGVLSTLRTVSLPAGALASVFTVNFGASGRTDPFGTEMQTRVTLGATGACTADVRCPAVRVDAGGAISVCKEGVCE